MEAVRRNWTELAKDVQRELYKRLFAGEPVEVYLADITTSPRKGELDHKLVYRKGLRKSLASYTANTPHTLPQHANRVIRAASFHT